MNVFCDGSYMGFRSMSKFCQGLGYYFRGKWISTGTFYSIFRDLINILELYPETSNLAFAWDKKPQYRIDIDANYKANREKKKDLEFYRLYIIMKKQLKELMGVFPLVGIDQYWMEGFEADDVLATLAYRANEDRTIIVTSDKDLNQIITYNVAIYDFKKERTNRWLRREYGIKPQRWREVQALTGDKTDNIQGISGVGIKTAIKLLRKYGDLDVLLASNESVIKRGNNREVVELARKLVTLKDDLELNKKGRDINLLQFRKFLVERKLKSILERFDIFQKYIERRKNVY